MSPMGPSRPPTHRGLSFDRMAKLAAEIETIAENGSVTAEALDDLAADLGAGVESLYAALATTDMRLEAREPIRFEICVGGCQDWGALANVEHLLDVRTARLESGKGGFDVVPRECLDKCRAASAVVAVSPDGRALIEAATPAILDDALGALLD